MAGIEHTKAALVELKDLVLEIKAIAPGGFEWLKDGTAAIRAGKDGFDLFMEVLAAKDAGEITDIDFAEAKELFGDLTAMVAEVLGSAA